MNLSSRLCTTFLLLFLCLAISLAHGGTRRHDVPDSEFTSYANSKEAFRATGSLSVNFPSSGQLCSGTLISSNWVLTAAHCIEEPITRNAATGMVFRAQNNTPFVAADWVGHSRWNGSFGDGYDIALVRLSSPSSKQPALRNASINELGALGNIVGYGRTGTGLTGATLNAGTRRAGQNVIDRIDQDRTGFSSILTVDFDRPGSSADNQIGSATPRPLEYIAAPGDSGGGLFASLGSGQRLIGVSSFSSPTGSGNRTYGDTDSYTRVLRYNSWIHSNIGGVPWTGGYGNRFSQAPNWGAESVPSSGSDVVFSTFADTDVNYEDTQRTVDNLRVDHGNFDFLNVSTIGIASDLAVARHADSVASLELSEGNLLVVDDVLVGQEGAGTLRINGSGRAVGGDSIQVAVEPDSIGDLYVSGANASVESQGILYVGYQGSGVAVVNGGASATADDTLRVGVSPGGNGTLNIDGAGSSVEITNLMSVGDYGIGTVNITNGGSLSSTNNSLRLGERSSTAIGTLNLSQNSSFSAGNGNVEVGYNGAGTVNIAGSATFTTADGMTIANRSGSGGTLNMLGGNLTLGNSTNDNLIVGHAGDGNYSQSSGTATVAGSIRLANISGSTGVASISGVGAFLESTGAISVGVRGTGSASVSGDAQVVSNGYLIVGDETGSDGVLLMEETSNVTAESLLLVAYNANSNGGLYVDGSSNMGVNGAYTAVGYSGTGVMNVSDSATFTNAGNLIVGLRAGSSGEFHQSGGTATVGGNLALGVDIGSTGIADFDGVDSRISIGGDVSVGGSLNGAGGNGALTISANTDFQAAGSLKVYDQGMVTIESGNVDVGVIDATEGQFNFTGGRLVTGQFIGDLSHEGAILIASQFDGNLTVNGGTLVISDFPSEDPVSMMNIDGDLLHQDGAIFFDLGGTAAGEFDTLHTTGLLALSEDDSRMVVNTVNGFEVGVGDVFEIISADGGVTGDFSRLRSNNTMFDAALEFELQYEPNSVSLVAVPILDGDFNADGEVNGSDFLTWQRNPTIGSLADWQANYGETLNPALEAEFTEVPEPASVLLLLSAVTLCNSLRIGCWSRCRR